MASTEQDKRLRAELAQELGFYPASLDPADVDRHRRLRLVHGDFDTLNGVIAQARQGNSVGKGFDQIQRVPFHVGGDRLGQSPIVDRLTKIISTRCR